MPELTWLDLSLLASAAALVGLSKTALPGAGTIAVAVFAAVLPARSSTGALLVLLILGDLFAVWAYHAHADWTTLRRMVPAVLAGIGVGAFFLATADDAAVRRIIGVILLALVAVTLARRAGARRRERRSGAGSAAGSTADPATDPAAGGGTMSAAEVVPVTVVVPVVPVTVVVPVVNGAGRRFETGAYGVLAGFTTMVANAGGPVMSLYFLAARFSVNQFLGTAAWFFLAVNLAKTPFSISLGLISAESLRLDLVLAPAVVVGALVGRRLARRINQALFDRLILALTILSASYLLL